MAGKRKKKNSNIANQMKSVFRIFFIFVFAVIIVFLITKRHDMKKNSSISDNMEKSIDRNEENSFLSEKDLFNKNRKDDIKENDKESKRKSHIKYEKENLNTTKRDEDLRLEEYSFDDIINEDSSVNNENIKEIDKSSNHSNAKIIYPDDSKNRKDESNIKKSESYEKENKKKSLEKDSSNKKTDTRVNDSKSSDNTKKIKNDKKDKDPKNEKISENEKKNSESKKNKDVDEKSKGSKKQSINKKPEGIISDGPVDIPIEEEVSNYGPVHE